MTDPIQPGVVACQVIQEIEEDGRKIVKVTTEYPWHVESVERDTYFDVLPDQLIDLE